MKLTVYDQKRIRVISSELVRQTKSTGAPVTLNELPCWNSMRATTRKRLGRAFKQVVMAGEIDGIKYIGKKTDNHSTYASTSPDSGSDILKFIRRLFR